MASLRQDDSAERFDQRWLRHICTAVARCIGGLRRGFGLVEPASCVVLRRTGDERGGGN